MSYNGWTNYETWLVNLWLTQDSDEDAREVAYAAHNDYAAGRALKDYTEDLIEQIAAPEGFIADLIGAALSEVDWEEIAAAYRADMPAEENAEENAEEDAEEDAE